MAPEILIGVHYNSRSDTWAIGVLLFIMVVGKFPFVGTSLETLFQKIVLDEVELDINTIKIRLLPPELYDFIL